jgi:hypothetical protein
MGSALGRPLVLLLSGSAIGLLLGVIARRVLAELCMRYLEACQPGLHQHSVGIAARRDKRRVDAIVRLFPRNLAENTITLLPQSRDGRIPASACCPA